MNLKKIKMVHETPNHFILHDGASHFHVAKKGLDSDMVKKIQGFKEGGVVKDDENPTPKEELDMAIKEAGETVDKYKKIPLKGYSEGGAVAPKPLAQEASDFFNRMKNPPEKKAEGGTIGFDEDFAQKFKKGSGFDVQHFDVGGTASGLPPDFDNRVEAEKQNLAINQTAMPPENIDNNNIVPATAQPLNPGQFQAQAETNIAKEDQDQMLHASRNEEAEKARTAQAVQDQNAQVIADNQVRMQSGLAPLPLTPVPLSENIQNPQSVPKENQVSFSPQQSPQVVPQQPQSNLTGNFDKSLKQIEGGMQQNAQLQSKLLAENAKNTQIYLEEQKQRAADYSKERAAIQSQNEELFNQVRDSKVDPNRIWNNAGTGQKISAALGLIFGGIGAGMTHSPNQAAEFLQKSIDADIDAQKSDNSNKTNLYKLGLEKYRDSQDAEKFASLQASNILAGQIQQTAQRIGSPQAMALAKQAIGELHMKYDPIRNDLALKQVALNYSQNQPQQSGTPQSGINTQKMNSFMNAGLYDDSTKKELIKEQGEYIKAKNFMDLTDNLFNEQSKNANYTNRIAGAQYFPTTRESTKQYNAAVNAYLDKMTKDLTGRVTPQSMENLHTSMPVAGDSPETLLAKRNAMKDIIKTAYDFPTLTNKGLLNQNDPILQSSANSNMKFQQGKPVIK